MEIRLVNIPPGNKVTKFLLPGLLHVLDTTLKNIKTGAGFVESFIEDKNSLTEYENCILLLFKPPTPIALQLFIETYKEHIKDEYDYEEGYVVIVFHYPVRFIHCYNLFLEGKYSEFTPEYRNIIPRPATLEERSQLGVTKTYVHRIFDKDAKQKELLEQLIGEKLPEGSEIASKWGEKEILDINEYLKNPIHVTTTKTTTENQLQNNG